MFKGLQETVWDNKSSSYQGINCSIYRELTVPPFNPQQNLSVLPKPASPELSRIKFISNSTNRP